MLVGGHVSIAGSFDQSIDRAVEIEANCLQTFASSPRSLKTSEFLSPVVDLYLDKKSKSDIKLHFFHGVYLVNLAHESASYVDASIDSLAFYQAMAGKIGGAGTIFHIGSHKGLGFAAVKKHVIASIEKVLIKTPDGVKLFLENAAGQKGAIGADLSELREIYDSISSPELREKLAVCYDTQHGFASGFDIRTQEALQTTISTIQNSLGLELIQVIHANDSMVEFDSHKDRHENIGAGMIGFEGFKTLLHHEKFHNLPFLLEVPGKEHSGPRKEDIQAFRSLFE